MRTDLKIMWVYLVHPILKQNKQLNKQKQDWNFEKWLGMEGSP